MQVSGTAPPAAIPEYVAREFEVTPYADVASLQKRLRALGRTAWLGAEDGLSARLSDIECNPAAVLDHIDYYRAYKSPYEIECIARATVLAERGHAAAAVAFSEGKSELEIHLAYLAAIRCADEDLPYRSIVALNENGSTLHHMVRQKSVPSSHRSMLIDAGARYHGYASDISRTHVAGGFADSGFASLIASLDRGQRDLVARIRVGDSFADLHDQAHHLVAKILVEHGIVRCGVDEAMSSGASRVFFPHGLGHLLGIQVHDRGGQLASPDGTLQPPPEAYPHLRFTRDLAPGMVFTVEPGIYFIDSLIEGFSEPGILDRNQIERFSAFGGIRIEDNVLVEHDGVRNFTREVFPT